MRRLFNAEKAVVTCLLLLKSLNLVFCSMVKAAEAVFHRPIKDNVSALD